MLKQIASGLSPGILQAKEAPPCYGTTASSPVLPAAHSLGKLYCAVTGEGVALLFLYGIEQVLISPQSKTDRQRFQRGTGPSSPLLLSCHSTVMG